MSMENVLDSLISNECNRLKQSFIVVEKDGWNLAQNEKKEMSSSYSYP
jgi:hypothetical protein